MDLNKAMILGRLTRDPEMRTTTNGKSVCSFSVATSRVYTDGAGQKQQIPEYHNIVAWGKVGEIAGQYLKKGKRVYVDGRLQTRSWEGQDGKKNYKTEIVLDNLIMLDGGTGAQGGSSQGAYQGAAQPAEPNFGQGAGPAGASADDFIASEEIPTIQQDQAGDEEITVEDIPF